MRPHADDEHDERDPTSVIYGQWRLPPLARLAQVVTAATASLSFASLPAAAIAAVVMGSSPAFLLVLPVTLPIFYIAMRWTINLWRTRVTITNRRVVIAGVTKTRSVPLDDVERFVAGDAGNQPTILLIRRHGRPLATYVFNRNGLTWSSDKLIAELQPLADQLNGCIETARQA